MIGRIWESIQKNSKLWGFGLYGWLSLLQHRFLSLKGSRELGPSGQKTLLRPAPRARFPRLGERPPY